MMLEMKNCHPLLRFAEAVPEKQVHYPMTKCTLASNPLAAAITSLKSLMLLITYS